MSHRKLPPGSDPAIEPSLAPDDLDADVDGLPLDDDLGGIIEAIASSGRPRPIADDVHDRILAQALGLSAQEASQLTSSNSEEPLPSDLEADRAKGLARALELASSTTDLDSLAGVEHPDVMRLVALARALRLAFSPKPIDSLTSERLLKPALRQPTRRNNQRFIFGAASALAALAAVFVGFWLTTQKSAPSASAELPRPSLPMTQVGSTDGLFGLDPFPRSGGASQRIDKITAARGADLRNNRFAAWGVE